MSDPAGVPILALNSGSSSLRFGLYRVVAGGSRLLAEGKAEARDGRYGEFDAKDADGNALVSDATEVGEPAEAINRIAGLLAAQGLPAPLAIGHRIVHGGPQCRAHTLIDATVEQQLRASTVFAPLHLPPALALIDCARDRFPDVPQAACLDTAFHVGMPDVARTFPIPRELRARGIERYGFHGLSCESIVRQLGGEVPSRLVIAHLGNGASVTAVASGCSIDTSMGLTPSGGVIMSTRCGDIDPGVLAYVVRELGYDASQLQTLVDQRSGLLGISGISGDLRELRAVSSSSADAQLAIAMFCYSVRKQIAAMVAALGGIDTLVFTGGIGENDAQTRASICEGLGGLGIGMEATSEVIGKPPAKVRRVRNGRNPACAVRVLRSRENEQIAWRTGLLLADAAP